MNFDFRTDRALDTVEFRSSDKEKPKLAVILMHGYGADASDLAPLSQLMNPDFPVHWIFPEAPIELGRGAGNGKAWFQIDLARLQRIQMGLEGPRTSGLTSPEGLESSSELVEKLIADVCGDLALTTEQLVIGGFSQGSMMALNTILTKEMKVAGTILLSTHFMNESLWTAKIPTLAGTRYLQSHGRRDQILSFDSANRLNKTLNQGGWKGQLQAFEGGHEIPEPIIGLAANFIKKCGTI